MVRPSHQYRSYLNDEAVSFDISIDAYAFYLADGKISNLLTWINEIIQWCQEKWSYLIHIFSWLMHIFCSLNTESFNVEGCSRVLQLDRISCEAWISKFETRLNTLNYLCRWDDSAIVQEIIQQDYDFFRADASRHTSGMLQDFRGIITDIKLQPKGFMRNPLVASNVGSCLQIFIQNFGHAGRAFEARYSASKIMNFFMINKSNVE
jgi:hypothetical protein